MGLTYVLVVMVGALHYALLPLAFPDLASCEGLRPLVEEYFKQMSPDTTIHSLCLLVPPGTPT